MEEGEIRNTTLVLYWRGMVVFLGGIDGGRGKDEISEWDLTSKKRKRI